MTRSVVERRRSLRWLFWLDASALAADALAAGIVGDHPGATLALGGLVLERSV